ncbi:unnamed protein product [Brachionus calyciflorus]|uniref:Deoxynucleoside kinase domain-containing protein n=1 Tax=Brachionus calyciflorus TaxID=104777 RepID=A0A813M9M9_9BILA|nr:unnamed protein product [Brachionus calyciflorus]
MISTVQSPKIVINSIEGNIACGKSTILDYMSSRNKKNTHCLQEPIAEWTNMKSGTDLLRLFYEEQTKWTFAFENLVQLSRMRSFYQVEKLKQKYQSESQNEEIMNFFVERSILSSYNVFTLNSFQENKLNQVEFDILTKFHDFFAKKLNSVDNSNEIFQIIYIKTSPEVCFQRLKKRNRQSENEISLDYLRNIQQKYENWINRLLEENNTRVQIIDGNSNQQNVISQIKKLNLF